MKKTKIFSLLAVTAVIGLAACNNEGEGTTAADTSTTGSTENSTVTTATSTTDYTALADTFRVNSEAGHYLDPRTGKSIRISVNPQTGARTNSETGEAITRYVDKRTWWVYGGNDADAMWDTVGTAKMQDNKLVYRSDNDKWVSYEERWKTETEKDGDFKAKSENLKIKTESDGDVKIKTEDGKKIKKDEDGVTVKDDK